MADLLEPKANIMALKSRQIGRAKNIYGVKNEMKNCDDLSVSDN